LSGFSTSGYTGEASPNRADAFVWAFAELFPGLVQPRREKKEAKPRQHNYGAAGWMG
jgi:phage terminase large subunit-like protein